ncbi:glycosyltransferase [Pontibacter beigongshangensis]|uniref:glycosyltransferase n=1 Tax=Pontibacter beigongshangensis TaxID=2574733 RepID=UPI00164F9B65|nr:glycosyltransferase [Pontibacter beigongshangensis]
MKKFGILSWPALSTKGGNPYNYILFSNIRNKAYPIHEFDFNIRNMLKYCLPFNYRIFHIHWPTHVLVGDSTFRTKVNLYAFFLFIRLIKAFGTRVVWTVHNLEAHESNFPELQEKLDEFMYSNVDGFISLNKAGLDMIKKKAKNPGKQLFAHTFHPHYKSYYLNKISRKQAREKLGVPEEKFVFLFLGQIRAYKNVTGLIKAYKEIKTPNAMLLIAGSVHRDIEAELYEQLEQAENIIFINSFIKDEELQYYFKCADVVVTPYNRIFNSGSAFLNLSFDKPTLAPDLWALSELKHTVGTRWIKTYEGALSAKNLESSMAEILHESKDSAKVQPDISHLEPEVIALETINFYNSLLGVSTQAT